MQPKKLHYFYFLENFIDKTYSKTIVLRSKAKLWGVNVLGIHFAQLINLQECRGHDHVTLSMHPNISLKKACYNLL